MNDIGFSEIRTKVTTRYLQHDPCPHTETEELGDGTQECLDCEEIIGRPTTDV